MDSTHGNSDCANAPYRTAFEALRQLPEPGKSSDIPNHSGRKHSQRIIDRYHGLEFGERDPNTRINKLHPERPSYTIIVGSDKGGGKGHVFNAKRKRSYNELIEILGLDYLQD